MFTNNYEEKAREYSKHKIEGTLSLAYEKMEQIFSKYVTEGRDALDFGCGSGKSTQFLKSMHFNSVDGVDIDKSMIKEATSLDKIGSYRLIENGRIPSRDSKYDLAFSSMVLLEIPTLSEMTNSMKEIYRSLKLNGTVVILTVNDDFYSHDWVSIDTNYPENKSPKSGDKVKVKINEINLELIDYYWKKEDYLKVFNASGFCVVEEIQPIASQNSGNQSNWKDETAYSPYLIFVLKKEKALKNVNEMANTMGFTCVPGKYFFKETKRAPYKVTFFDQTRDAFSEIELLMEAGHAAWFHKSATTEIFSHIDGRDMIIHTVDSNGTYQKIFLGKENENAVSEFTIKANTWFAEEVMGEKGFSMLTVRNEPAFDVSDISQITKDDLLKLVLNNTAAIEEIERLHSITNEVSKNFKKT